MTRGIEYEGGPEYFDRMAVIKSRKFLNIAHANEMQKVPVRCVHPVNAVKHVYLLLHVNQQLMIVRTRFRRLFISLDRRVRIAPFLFVEDEKLVVYVR